MRKGLNLRRIVINIPAVSTAGELRAYLRAVLLEGRPQVRPSDREYIVEVCVIGEEKGDFESWFLIGLAQVTVDSCYERVWEIGTCYEWLSRRILVRDEDRIEDIKGEWKKHLEFCEVG